MAGILRVRRAATHLTPRSGVNLNSRSFGAGAAVQLQDDYDYYDDGDHELNRDRPRLAPVSDSDGSMVGRGVQWVFIGNPGAQKHVYAEKLSKLLQVPHISMGTLVRQEFNHRSSLYKQIANAVNEMQIANAVNKGKLVPEDIIFGILSKRLQEGYYRGETGFILDGIPQNQIQAEILDQIADIDLVVNFRCTKDCLVKTARNSGTSLLKTSSAGAEDASSAGAEDAQNEKLRIYEEKSKPVEDYYRKRMKLLDFQVAGGAIGTWQGLLAALHLKHINASNSSQRLTVL